MDLDLLRRSYDRFAAQYDAVFEAQQAPKIRGLLAALPRDAAGPWLDLGAGTGLAARLSGRPFVELDASAGMLARSPSRWRVQGDLRRLPFATGCAGVALAVTSLIDFGRAPPEVAECARVLRPGGLLALSVLKTEAVSLLRAALADAPLDPLAELDLDLDVGFVLRRHG